MSDGGPVDPRLEQVEVEEELEERREELEAEEPAPAEPGGYAPSVLERFAVYQRAGGIVTPILTAVLAFFVGGLVVLASGSNPLTTYKAIFNGTGLNWLFPWVTGAERTLAAINLQQTLLLTTPLILTGLAVAFAFRCGMFNIGGQGQYIVGSIMAVWIGASLHGLPGWLHIVLAIVLAALMGGAWAGIAGILKATIGAHEVITTIMLNWIAYWIGSWLFGLGGPLQSDTQTSVPVSNDIAQNAHLHVFWGDPVLQGLHIGFFIAIGALVAYWITLNRTTLGYEVRAVGFNPEAARYGGIGVARNYFLAMAIAGSFAGLAGAMDVLGWEFRINVNDIQASTVGFIGIAVALLGRNTAVGVFFSALLFGALVNGTSTRNLDPSIFRPELASNLTLIIQGLVVLFVGADVLILYVWSLRKKLRPERAHATEAKAAS
ncbi:MAG TPA: ABC transporter permease [Gaiellaceae bacterium]|jgi:simple sugar transport system permease protein